MMDRIRSLAAWWRERRTRILQLWGVGVLASLLVTGASSLGYLEALQARSVDLLLQFQGQRFAPEVVVVAIDEDAFESVGRRQPLPRSYLAKVIRGLQRAGAAVVGLDLALFSSYDRMGVKDLATDSFDEARFLSAPRP